MSENQPHSEEKQGPSLLQKTLATLVTPMVIVITLGYVGVYTTVTELRLLVKQNEARISFTEQYIRDHEREFRELQVSIARHSSNTEQLFSQIEKMLSESYRGIGSK